MTKYIFLNVPGYGHINPTLAVVQELVARGEEVIYFAPEQFRTAIEATGAKLYSYETSMRGGPPQNRMATPNAGLPMMMIGESRKVLPQVLGRIQAEKPDFIVYDHLSVWARIAAETLHIPTIGLRPTYATNGNFNFQAMMKNASQGKVFNPAAMMANMQGELAKLCEEYHIEPFSPQDIFMHSEPLNIVFLPKAFQPGGESFDERFVFVGPSITPRHDTSTFPFERLQENKPLLYISLGTVFNQRTDFFKLCFEAFSGKSWQVVLSKGERVNMEELGSIPDNFIVASYVPQLELLPRTRVFITHGGMNSTMESLYNGVPMVVVPQMVEQAMTAKRVAELELGIALNTEDVTAEALRNAVERISNDPGYYQRAQDMQQKTHEAGGYKRAADAIIQYSHSYQLSTTKQ